MPESKFLKHLKKPEEPPEYEPTKDPLLTMSIEEKRAQAVNYCYEKYVFKPEFRQAMAEKFAPIVAKWKEERLNEWIRWGDRRKDRMAY